MVGTQVVYDHIAEPHHRNKECIEGEEHVSLPAVMQWNQILKSSPSGHMSGHLAPQFKAPTRYHECSGHVRNN